MLGLAVSLLCACGSGFHLLLLQIYEPHKSTMCFYNPYTLICSASCTGHETWHAHVKPSTFKAFSIMQWIDVKVTTLYELDYRYCPQAILLHRVLHYPPQSSLIQDN
jgi:hypothetical protein